jgi:hypothetical protein
VYRRKVDQANKSRAQLRQAIADCEAELAAICSAMGERPVHIRQVRYFNNCNNLLIFVHVCYLNTMEEVLNLKII